MLRGDAVWLQQDLLASGLVLCGERDCCALLSLGLQGFSGSWNYSTTQVPSGVFWGTGSASGPVVTLMSLVPFGNKVDTWGAWRVSPTRAILQGVVWLCW